MPPGCSLGPLLGPAPQTLAESPGEERPCRGSRQDAPSRGHAAAGRQAEGPHLTCMAPPSPATRWGFAAGGSGQVREGLAPPAASGRVLLGL